MKKTKSSKNKKYWIIGGGTTAVVVAGAATGVALAVSKKDTSNSKNKVVNQNNEDQSEIKRQLADKIFEQDEFKSFIESQIPHEFSVFNDINQFKLFINEQVGKYIDAHPQQIEMVFNKETEIINVESFEDILFTITPGSKLTQRSDISFDAFSLDGSSSHSFHIDASSVVNPHLQDMQHSLEVKLRDHHDDSEIITFIKYDKTNPLINISASDLTTTKLMVDNKEVDLVFQGYNQPAHNQSTGELSLEAFYKDEDTIRMPFVINVPFDKTVDQFNTDKLQDSISFGATTPVTNEGGADVKEITEASDDAARETLLISMLHTLGNNDFAQTSLSDIKVANYSDTAKDFTISFKAAFGAATPKNISMHLIVAQSQVEATTDPNVVELDDFIRQNIDHLTINANLDRPDIAITNSDLSWADLNTNFIIKSSTFVYSAPHDDLTKGVITFDLVHNSATKSVTKEVNFNLSLNQYKTNSLTNISSGDSTTPSKITIDNIVDLDGVNSNKVTIFRNMLSAISNTSLSAAKITDISLNNTNGDDKVFAVNFKASFGGSTPKDLTLTITTNESKNQLIARKKQAELVEWVKAHSSQFSLKSTVNLSNPLTQIDKLSFNGSPFDVNHVLVSIRYVAPAHNEITGHAILKVGSDDLGTISTSYTFDVNFTQSSDDFELTKFAENVTLGSSEHHSRFINVDELKSAYSDHSKLLTLMKIALPAVQSCKDVDAVNWGPNGHPIDTRVWDISNARFINEPAFNESAEFHTIQVDATSVTGQKRVMTIKVYQRLGLQRLYKTFISPQSGVLSKSDVPLDPNRPDLQTMMDYIQKVNISKDAMVAAESLKRYMNLFADQGWGIQGDSMVDGFNAIRFVAWREAMGDKIPKMLLDGFIKGSFSEIREGMEARRKQVIRNMFANQGYPEMQQAEISNLKFENKVVDSDTPNPYTDETKVMNISFDAKIASWPAAKSFSWKITLSDDITEKAIANNNGTEYKLWSTSYHSRLEYLEGIFGGYKGSLYFKQDQLDKLLTPSEESEVSKHFAFDASVGIKIGGTDYGWQGINIINNASNISYDLDSTKVEASVRLNYRGARRTEILDGQLTKTPNTYLTSLIKDSSDESKISLSGEYANEILKMNESQKLQVLRDLYLNAFGTSTLSGADISDLSISIDQNSKIGTINYKAKFGQASAIGHVLKFKFMDKEDQTSDQTQKKTTAMKAYIALSADSFKPTDLNAFTDKVYSSSPTYSPSDFNNEFTGSTIKNIVVIPPRYSVAKVATVSFDVEKDGFVTHRSYPILLSQTKLEHNTNEINIQGDLNMSGESAQITGSDFKIIRQNFKETSFYDISAKQVNDWLEDKESLFISTNGFDGGDTHWIHGAHADNEFVAKDTNGNYKYQFNRNNPEMDWKNMRPYRLGFITSEFAQERSQMIDHLDGFDMHQWWGTIAAFTNPTIADVQGIKRADWGKFAKKPMFPAKEGPADADHSPHSPAGDVAGNNDNYLVVYQSIINGVSNPNGVSVDFCEGLASGVWNLYDATDGSRSGGHRTAMMMANNDRMGWSPGKSGTFFMNMVEYGRFEDDIKAIQFETDLKNANNPRQEIVDIRAKYPWSNSATGIFAGLGFDAYIAKAGILKFVSDVFFKLIDTPQNGQAKDIFNYALNWIMGGRVPSDPTVKTIYEQVTGNKSWANDTAAETLLSKIVKFFDARFSSTSSSHGDYSTVNSFAALGGGLITEIITAIGLTDDIITKFSVTTTFFADTFDAQHNLKLDRIKQRINHVTESTMAQDVYYQHYLKAMEGLSFDVANQFERDSMPYDINGGASIWMDRAGSTEYPEDLYAVLDGE